MIVNVPASGGDDTAAIASALASGATAICLPDADYVVSQTLVVPPRMDIKGAGKYSTRVHQAAGFDPQWGIFHCLNGGYNEFTRLSFIGNGLAAFNNGVGAVSVHLDATATAPTGPVGIYDCHLSGFQNDNWIKVWNEGNFPIELLDVDGCDFISVMGNSRYYHEDGVNHLSTFIQAWGVPNSLSAPGAVTKLKVRNNHFDGTGMMLGIKSWQNVLETAVQDNYFLDVGRGCTGPTDNIYVILLYTQGAASVINGGGSISGNRIKNKYFDGVIGPACGLYAARTGPVHCHNNRVQGIYRPNSGPLLRAGMTFLAARQVTCVGNTFYSNSTGIAFGGSADYLANSSHLIASNNIFSDAGSSVGINVGWSNSGSYAPKLALRGNVVSVTGAPVVKSPGSYGSIADDTV
jgi:hypothetical protein